MFYPKQLLLLILVFPVLLVGCNDDKGVAPKPIRPVLSQLVEVTPYWQTNIYSGEIRARHETDLGFRINGKIIERRVEAGDKVKPGDILARLDPDDYRLQLTEAEAQLTVAQAERNKAAADLERYDTLLQRKLVSEEEFQNYQKILDVASAKERQASAAVNVARNQHSYTTLIADREGVVTSVQADEGEVVAAGQSIVQLALCCEKEVEISVPENRLDAMRGADDIRITLWALPGKRYTAQLRELSPTADRITRTYRVRLTLAEVGPDISYGMTATAKVRMQLHKQIVHLPLSAIFQKGTDTAVWVVDSERLSVKLQPVTIAEYRQDGALISSGLNGGERVVSAGVHRLVAGQQVRLLK
ncbi:MAG: efflux RND transporter periplasmic adaptor subunit [Gammaproteobacteria bacterium]|nr:efflux RND transporter periplasmic adaptor subunit [Gammaproteobacteria bacterium]